MDLVKKYLTKYRSKFALSVILAIGGVIMGLIPYYFIAQMIIGMLNGNTEINFYGKYSVIILVCFLLKELMASSSTAISHGATFCTLRDIRKDLSDKLYKLPLGEITSTPSGKLKSIIVDSVESMETTLAHIVPEMTANMLGPILLLIYVFILDWRLALLSIVPMFLGSFFMKPVMASYKSKYQESVSINQRMNNSVVEYIKGIEVIKAFNQGDESYKKFSDAVYDNASFFYGWMKSTQWGIAAFKNISPMSLLTVLPFGLLFYTHGSLSLSNFILIVILTVGIIEPLLKTSNFVDELSRIGTITKSISDILNAEELDHSEEDKAFNNYDIEFKNVSFAYSNGENALNDVSLNIKQNEVTAFVGLSGSGKSTITKLLAGFWDIKEGKISIGKQNIKDIPLHQISEKIAYVSQDNYLFDLSVRENIRIGNPNASDEEVEQMAKDAGCYEFISQLEKGYDTIVGEGGGHVSGGERQRISIARAMLKDAPIVILDEATAYMDPENEGIIQSAINKLIQGKTLIVVAHRLHTIVDADNIFVVNEGSIEDSGTHKELLQKSNRYKEMWAMAVKEDNDDNNI